MQPLPWAETAFNWLRPYLNKLSVAILTLLVGAIIAKLLSRLIRRVLDELEVDLALKKSVGIKLSVSKLLSAFVSFIVYFITIILFLNSLGLTAAILNVLSIGVIVLIFISAALAIRDFIPNFFAGFLIKTKKHVQPGDRIEVKDVEGKVLEISFLDTEVKTKSGDIIFIPNSLLLKNVLRKK